MNEFCKSITYDAKVVADTGLRQTSPLGVSLNSLT